MKIIQLRILPPIAIGRLGEAELPLAAYDLKISDKSPLDFREIIPKETLLINPETGEASSVMPEKIKFKDSDYLDDKSGNIHPVAPFLEAFVVTDENPELLVPLTEELLEQCSLTIADVSWDIELGNIKIFRRTEDPNDKIFCNIYGITSHEVRRLEGHCANFITGKTLPLGSAQYIRPNNAYPGLRLRFTPAKGKVYGSTLYRDGELDPVFFSRQDDPIIYDSKKGKWLGYPEAAIPNPTYTNPAQIFAGSSNAENAQISWGYLDDECDGFVTLNLRISENDSLKATAHISAGPPAFAPDTLPIRVVSDELEQLLLGTDIDGEVTVNEAQDIIRRAFETIRLMNTAVMNGNSFEGKQNIASTMVRQNTNDFGRLFEPIMAPTIVDNLTLQILHERAFTALSGGAAPWFSELLRKPTEIGDLSSQALRKMPALMRGADGRSLTFTYRQINTIIKAVTEVLLPGTSSDIPEVFGSPFEQQNLIAQLHYRGAGNPVSVLPRTAISNCFPGLELDFRNLWRRAFKGIILIENNNYVLEADPEYSFLVHHRLVAIDKKPTMVKTTGPVFPDSDSVDLKTSANPNGVSFMEWSNGLVEVLQKQGQKIMCHFTKYKCPEEIIAEVKDLDDTSKFLAVELTVNDVFDGYSAAFSKNIIKPGELTQGLCAPWQNDYRECACYYWAASRPDYVNVEPDEKGLSTGDNWMSKQRTGRYLPDDRKDSRLLSYDDLFINWQGELNFIIKGKDALES